MRAVVVESFAPFGRFDHVTVAEVPDPRPGPGEVVVATHVAGVNYADAVTVAGEYPVKPSLPFTPGLELAGVVAAVGSEVTQVHVGDRVAASVAHGAFAELAVVPANACYMLPADMPFEHGASLGLVYQTAHFALTERAHMSSGERVLVTGASGGVGIASIQLAKALGCTVLAAIRNPSHADVVSEAGADRVIEIASENPARSLADQVREVTHDYGADVIVDLVGGELFDGCMQALAWGGRIVVVGFASGRLPSVDINRLLADNLSVIGLYWLGYRMREPEWVRRVQSDLFLLYSQGKLMPYVMQVYPLGQFADALTAVVEGRVKGKVLLSVRRKD